MVAKACSVRKQGMARRTKIEARFQEEFAVVGVRQRERWMKTKKRNVGLR